MIYVYAIMPSAASIPGGLPGLNEQPIVACACDSVAGVYSEHTGDGIVPTAENVWRHEQVIERLMSDQPVLPARFGTVLADQSALRELLDRNAGALSAGLGKVSGRVELGLRGLWNEDVTPAEPTAAARSGRDYMLARLEEERRRRDARGRAERVARELDGALKAHAADSTTQIHSAQPLIMSGAYLVDRDRTNDFRRAVALLGRSHPDVRLLCTGPWPPYHFVPAIRAEVAHA